MPLSIGSFSLLVGSQMALCPPLSERYLLLFGPAHAREAQYRSTSSRVLVWAPFPWTSLRQVPRLGVVAERR